MFCTNCGKQLEDDVIFCPECGTKVAVAATSVVEEPAKAADPKAEKTPVAAAPVAPTPADPQKKNKGPIIVIVILALLVVALGIAILFLYNDKKQDKDDDWESTEAFADEDEEDDEEEEEPTPELTEEPTPEPTEEPTPEPTEVPTPEPTEAPTPEPTEEPEVEPSDNTIVWDDPVFDVDPSAYEKCTVYETELDVSGICLTDRQTILADGDMVAILIESTTIDMSTIPEEEISYYEEVYAETYEPIRQNAPDSVEVIHGLDGNVYRFEMIVYLEDANLKELADAGYISITSGSAETAVFISYDQTCAGLEAGGYTLVE